MRIPFLLFGICLSTLIYGQMSGGDTYIPTIIPPTPNAAAIEKFGTIPVDYSTGIPGISYPVYAWSRGKLSLNLGLSYHAGGHKVEDMPSNTGLGWTMNGLGRVSRTVRGIPDDHPVKGYMNTPVLPQLVTNLYTGGYVGIPGFVPATWQAKPTSEAISVSNSPYSALVIDMDKGFEDGEMDIFSYSCNGLSGRFVIDKNKQIIPLEYTNNKIEMFFDVNDRINKFVITDDKGIVYTFAETEMQNSQTVTTSPAISPGSESCYSGWLITKIEDPSTLDQISITYSNTSTGNVVYETGFSQNQTFSFETKNSSQLLVLDYTASDVYNYSQITITDQSVQAITLPDGSTINFMYDFSRQDLTNSKALTEIQVKNMYNEIVKRTVMSYGYFNSPGGSGLPGGTANDFSKRLKLEKVEEISNDGLLSKPTVFEYNTLQLNRRDSKNIDFWGYNVNPARNNTGLVPKIRLEDEEYGINPAYGRYLDGANRNPDAAYGKAAILEKIIYPTGGFNQFIYECNRAFDADNYYEDKKVTDTARWLPAAFNSRVFLNFSERSEMNVSVYIKITEDAPRGTVPTGCIGDMQDINTIKFRLRSYDDPGFDEIIELPYNSFLAGSFINIAVPLSVSSFWIECIYDVNETCAFMWPFTVKAAVDYTIPKHDKLVGGLRIKQVIADDGIGNQIIKEYKYDAPDVNNVEHSSATVNVIPNYKYYRTTLNVANNHQADLYARKIHRNSNPTYTLSYQNGGPLVYKKVKEVIAGHGWTERLYDDIYNNYGVNKYPYMPYQDYSNLSGLLKKEIVKNEQGNIKQEKTIEYNRVLNQLMTDETRGMKVGSVASGENFPGSYYVTDNYRMAVTRAEVVWEETKVYEESIALTSRKDMTYDANKYYLKSVTTKDSKDVEREQLFTYPYEMVGTAYTHMINKNIIASPVYTQLHRTGLILNDPYDITTRTNYTLWNSSTLAAPASVEVSTASGPFRAEVTFNDYDTKGNIRQYTGKDGVVTSFIWGYKSQYPVAKIVGKSYADIVSLSGINLTVVDNPASDAAMKAELDKLRTVSGCLVSTYLVKPLTGNTCETDPNGRNTWYEYDTFNRLKRVLDHDLKVIKVIDYQYQKGIAD